MNTHTRLMHSRIKLTKAQRNNLKIVLKSFFFQQITPHKEEHFRCKFVNFVRQSKKWVHLLRKLGSKGVIISDRNWSLGKPNNQIKCHAI